MAGYFYVSTLSSNFRREMEIYRGSNEAGGMGGADEHCTGHESSRWKLGDGDRYRQVGQYPQQRR